MGLNANNTTKSKTKAPADSAPLKKKKSLDKKTLTTKPAPTKETKVKKDEDEPTRKAKKANVTFVEPVNKETETSKSKAKVTEQPKEKKSTKAKPSAPQTDSDNESKAEKASKPKKPRTKPSKQTTPAKEPPKLISANASTKTKSQTKPAASTTKSSKAKQKAKSPSPAPSNSDDEVEDDDDEEEEVVEQDVAEENSEDEEDVHLHGFSTDEDDSSDEENEGEDQPGLSTFEINKLPTVAKDDESVKRRLEKAKRQPTEDRGVIYIGRLPHGFYEDQLKGYFSQFGDITRLRLSRNKKTGKCKHYGFIEFDSSSVAQIVAETMDNYLLAGHILRCKLIPKDEVHPELWIGANRKWRLVPRDRIIRVQHNKPRTIEQKAKANQRLIKRQNARKRKLEALGIEYDFNPVSYKKPKASASS